MAPKKSKSKSKQRISPVSTTSRKKQRKGGKENDKKAKKRTFSSYIFRVLREVKPGMEISSKSMSVMNSFMNDMFDRIAAEAAKLAKRGKKRTLSSREIQTAVRLILPGELAKHAVSEGTKAVAKYTSSITASHAFMSIVTKPDGYPISLESMVTTMKQAVASGNQTSTTSKTISATETSAAAITKTFPTTNSSSSLTLAAISKTYESLATTGSPTVSSTKQTTVLNSSKSTRTATSTPKTSPETTQSSPTTTVVTSPIASSSISTSTSTSMHAVLSSKSSKSATGTTYSTTSPPSTKVTTKASTKHTPSSTQLTATSSLVQQINITTSPIKSTSSYSTINPGGSTTNVARLPGFSEKMITGPLCQQCGDINSRTPCQYQDVFLGKPTPCRSGQYCQTDIRTENNSNKEIYKRCVDEKTCIRDWLMQSSDKEYCVRYGQVSKTDTYVCSFCCVGDDCNTGLLPKNSTLYGSRGP
ncbi:hypothetical protein FSP39_007774 [Pinctada imbricata]|uniref:Histone H2B n=1 Tax=Pinctada imbricata TaxID=66713 RepID=A0AA88XNJ0_PINIB|nr:hypothetical protein FSP39_007774 [Pinctada imbricata]